MLFWTVLATGFLLIAASLARRPKRAGAGWSLDIGYGDRGTRPARIVFVVGAALVILALLALAGA
jgi:hypothetical protein